MQTYTLSNARQNFFKIVKNTSKSNQPTQITFHPKGRAQNNNVYIISQNQYEILKKKLKAKLIQDGIHNLTKYAINNTKPMTKKEFEHEIGL